MKQKNSKNSNITAWIWITVLLLTHLLLVTAVLTATILYKQDVGTDVIISLTPDRAEAAEYKTFYKPAEVKPSSDAEIGGKAWEADTEINLFKRSYVNGSGETTVNAANGDKIIAPGTTNVFEFALKNTGNVVLKYTTGIKGLFGLTDKNLPVSVRIRCGDDWVIGSEHDWVKMSDVEAITYISEINVGAADIYRIEWQWPFEGTDDIDTTFGNLAIDVEKDFNMTITTVTEEVPGAVAKDKDGNLLYERIMNPVLFILIIITGLLVTTLGILLVIFFKKKKKANFSKKNGGEQSPSAPQDKK